MDDNAVDQEFEKIVVNEQIRVMDRELGRVSGVNGFDGSGGELPFEKFLKPFEDLPDIDTDYVDRQRDSANSNIAQRMGITSLRLKYSPKPDRF